MDNTDKLLLTVAEAARLTGIGRSRAYEFIATGEWPSIRLGRSRRIRYADLVNWIEAQPDATRGGHRIVG